MHKEMTTIADVALPIEERWGIKRCRYATEGASAGRVCIATGTHGDEMMGQLIVYRIEQRIAADPNALNGVVDFYPMLNPLGLDIAHRMVPSATRLDMNRAFPGSPDGTPLEYLCWQIIQDMSGADLVLELPCRFACAPAPDFASGGVALLRALGVVTHLSFGCEAQSMDILFAARDALRDESPAFQSVLKDALDRGLPYPRARALAAESASGLSGLAEQIALPNAALALEYLQALPDGISAVPILREGCGYHDSSPSPLASATGVRAALTMGDVQTAGAAVPFPEELLSAERRGEFHPEDVLTQALFYRLRTMDAASLRDIAGMDEGLENRFIAAAQTCSTREALLDCVKTRRYTRARLSRLCAYALLNLTRDFAQTHRAPDYARVLGFRKSAAPLLKTIKQRSSIPLITKAANFDRSNSLFALDVLAQDLWSLGVSNPSLRASGRDFTTSPAILSR